jgi:hypothetical protein
MRYLIPAGKRRIGPSRARERAARRFSRVTRRAVTSGSEASTRRARVERKRRSTSSLRSPWKLSHVIPAGGDATGPAGPVRAPPAEESRDASGRDQQVRGVGAKSSCGKEVGAEDIVPAPFPPLNVSRDPRRQASQRAQPGPCAG